MFTAYINIFSIFIYLVSYFIPLSLIKAYMDFTPTPTKKDYAEDKQNRKSKVMCIYDKKLCNKKKHIIDNSYGQYFDENYW